MQRLGTRGGTCRACTGPWDRGIAVASPTIRTRSSAHAMLSLVVGLGDGETFIASDPTRSPHTRRVVFLEDGEIARSTRAAQTQRLDGGAHQTVIEELAEDWAMRRRATHFMLKEIHEQPEALRQCSAGAYWSRTARRNSVGSTCLRGNSSASAPSSPRLRHGLSRMSGRREHHRAGRPRAACACVASEFRYSIR